jgi:CTP:molybdopterin cytidylyltransferase MocA
MPPVNTTTPVALILAAGGGVRFTGTEHKLRALLDGRAVVAHAVGAAVEADIGPVVVVTGAVDITDLLPAEVTVVHHDRWAEGIASSLRVGVDVARNLAADAVVVGLGDQPFVGFEAWRAVAAAGDRPIAIATYDGERSPPVRLSSEVWPLLPVSGDEGARALMRWRPELVGEVPCPGRAIDIDTQEDLARWS